MWRLMLLGELFLFGSLVASAGEGKPNLSGKWKLQDRSDAGQSTRDLLLLIEENGENIHMKESRGADAKEAVSDFTCDTIGKECEMQDGGAKASVSVYYNGPVLVVLKTHGRKNNSVEKRRLLLSPEGDRLTIEVIHIAPEGKTEKLMFSKAE